MAKEHEWRDATPMENIINKLPIKSSMFFVVAIVVILVGVFTCALSVPANSEAVVLRFGKYVRTLKSGFHLKMPFGVETVEVRPVKRALKLEFGDATPGATNKFQSKSPSEQMKEKSMITGDRNAVMVEWVVQYQINDLKSFLFNVRNPEETLRDAAESVMRQVVGDRSVDEVLTIGRNEVVNVNVEMLQELVNSYKIGIRIINLQLKEVNPPSQVKASFSEVIQAQQIREETINKARGRYNREVPKMRGVANSRIKNAEGYAISRINEAEGDANKFLSLLVEYEKAPKVTRQRIYLETMTEILGQIPNKVIIDESAKSILPFLNIGNLRQIQRAKPGGS